MSETDDPDDPPGGEADLAARVQAALPLLEELAGDLRKLAALDEPTRIRLVTATGMLSRPDRYSRRNLGKALMRQRAAAKRDADRALLDQTGIRALRREPVFRTPLPRPAQALDAPVRDDGEMDDGGLGGGRGRARARRRRGAARAGVAPLLRVQAALPRAAPLLRSDVPAVRGVQLAEAHPDRRPARPRRADHRRARQDRLPGLDQAAARRRARRSSRPASRSTPPRATRTSPTSPSFRAALADLRARPAPYAERRARSARTCSTRAAPGLHREQRLPDRAPAAGLLRALLRGARRSAERAARGAAPLARSRRLRARSAPPDRRARRAARAGGWALHARAVAGAAARRGLSRRRPTCSPQGRSIRTCSRSTCARSTAGGCACTRSRPRAARGAARQRRRAVRPERAAEAAACCATPERDKHIVNVSRDGGPVLPATTRPTSIRTRTWPRPRST